VKKPSKERFSHFPKEEAFMFLLNLFRQQQAVGDIPKSGPMVENRTRLSHLLITGFEPQTFVVGLAYQRQRILCLDSL
jgi:hypothetical protein